MTESERIEWTEQHRLHIECLNKQIEVLQLQRIQNEVAIREAKKAVPPFLVALREAEEALGQVRAKIDKAEHAYLSTSRSLTSAVQDRTQAGIKLDKLTGKLPHYAGDDLRP